MPRGEVRAEPSAVLDPAQPPALTPRGGRAQLQQSEEPLKAVELSVAQRVG